jgi:hypothetical protein
LLVAVPVRLLWLRLGPAVRVTRRLVATLVRLIVWLLVTPSARILLHAVVAATVAAGVFVIITILVITAVLVITARGVTAGGVLVIPVHRVCWLLVAPERLAGCSWVVTSCLRIWGVITLGLIAWVSVGVTPVASCI